MVDVRLVTRLCSFSFQDARKACADATLSQVRGGVHSCPQSRVPKLSVSTVSGVTAVLAVRGGAVTQASDLSTACASRPSWVRLGGYVGREEEEACAPAEGTSPSHALAGGTDSLGLHETLLSGLRVPAPELHAQPGQLQCQA